MRRFVILAAAFTAMVGRAPAEPAGFRLELREGWAIQSSAKVTAGGEAVSRPGFATAGWHRATVPTTVVSALVADGTYPDPYYGMNLRKIPGTAYKVGTNFSNQEMPANSPFAVPWWYRTEFTLPPDAAGKTLWLQLDGVVFRFDAWLNGKKIADAAKTAGSYRVHELDVTAVAKPGSNALAVLVSAPKPTDLSITFVDWNPMPPDKLMGLYRPVTILSTGPVALRHPQVVTKVSPTLDRAELTVKVFATNASPGPGHRHAEGPGGGRLLPEGGDPRRRRDARDRDRAEGRPRPRRREPEALVAGPVRRARPPRPRPGARRERRDVGPGEDDASASASSRRSSRRAASSTA